MFFRILFIACCFIHVFHHHPRYKFDTPFEREIKREVFKIVGRGREFATLGYIFRATCYLALYFYLQYLWIVQGSSYRIAIVYGLVQAAIGMNVQHDANHGAVSRHHPWINELLGLGADLIGGDKWLWMEQHWTHHAYTNHAQKDPDSFAGEPLFIFNNYPRGDPRRQWYHKFQAFVYLILLGGYWVSNAFNPQILDLRQRGAERAGIRMESDYIQSRRKYAIALRLYYLLVHIGAPLVHYGLCVRAIGHTLVMGIAGSWALATLFSLSHCFEGCERDPTEEARQTGEPVCWFKAQCETSCTYGGAISGYFTGGLNFQIEHHLFPRMSSAWYPYIAPKVREVCAKHGVQYTYYPWPLQNLWSTMKYLHSVGQPEGASARVTKS